MYYQSEIIFTAVFPALQYLISCSSISKPTVVVKHHTISKFNSVYGEAMRSTNGFDSSTKHGRSIVLQDIPYLATSLIDTYILELLQ